MSTKVTWSFLTLPVELVYRIFDHLKPVTIFQSCRNICTRLNNIIDTYEPYQVNVILHYIFNIYFVFSYRDLLNLIFLVRISMVKNCNAYVIHYIIIRLICFLNQLSSIFSI